ncbi:ATP-dependent helicase [Jonquetella anthropi]|nr:UvrD-helicase domain-containing protein [Jonquetella anthropi]
MDESAWLKGLNDAQKEAVVYLGKRQLILAGAGSGKTRVLTRKIAWLIDAQRVKPWRILAVTFTNKAAREMLDRLTASLGENLAGLQVRTFHSFGLQMLFRSRAQLEQLGYPPQCVVYDRADSLSAAKAVLEALNLDPEQYTPAWVLETISKAKNSGAGLGAFDNSPMKSIVGPLYERYDGLLKSRGAWDFDDLIALPLELLTRFPEVKEREQKALDWVLVDEYQDVNAAQYRLMRLLASGGANLTAVGDPDQSIYGWRGADMSMIMNFERDFPGASVMLLEQNYRSTGGILEAANSLISHNFDRREKNLWTDREQGAKPQVWNCPTSDDEAELITTEIERFLSSGYRASDVAILYRMNALSRRIEESLLSHNLPYQVVRGQGFFDRREVRDVLSYLRLALNPYDRASLDRVGNLPTRGLGPRSLDKLDAYLLSHRTADPADVWAAVAQTGAELSGQGAAGARQLAGAMGEILGCGGDLKRALDVILMRIGYETVLQKIDPAGWEDRYDNVMEILSLAGDGDSLPELLAQAALYTDADRDSGGQGINLSTLHGAKGLEFPLVFMIGLEEGIFPHSRSSDDPAEIEEERRLCYVGMTRAQERLILTRVRERRLFGSTTTQRPSRFLAEIAPDLRDEFDFGEVRPSVGYRFNRPSRRW